MIFSGVVVGFVHQCRGLFGILVLELVPVLVLPEVGRRERAQALLTFERVRPRRSTLLIVLLLHVGDLVLEGVQLYLTPLALGYILLFSKVVVGFVH